jgi:hypothetical protein
LGSIQQFFGIPLSELQTQKNAPAEGWLDGSIEKVLAATRGHDVGVGLATGDHPTFEDLVFQKGFFKLTKSKSAYFTKRCSFQFPDPHETLRQPTPKRLHAHGHCLQYDLALQAATRMMILVLFSPIKSQRGS